ncbi:MAG: hypothetical protein A3E87_07430 [Gammaproteobacteria bacterium RIFCSPHIGHO2_12_FULL_35_23]|nr:MAG: hypothetical protein A3E87_07430 [Gammaproteobacteria bacterium RIFCSPHIGHO2_12_FULL_35_23]
MTKQIEKFKVLKIIFKEVFSEDNRVCSLHVIHAIDNNGLKFYMQSQAIFYVDNCKITKCIELTHFIENKNDWFLMTK